MKMVLDQRYSFLFSLSIALLIEHVSHMLRLICHLVALDLFAHPRMNSKRLCFGSPNEFQLFCSVGSATSWQPVTHTFGPSKRTE